MLEQKKLDEFLQVINENLKELREKKKEVDQENKELYDAYMEGDVELYSSLMVSSTMQDHVNHTIRDKSYTPIDAISAGDAVRAGEWALGMISDERYEGHLVLVEGNRHGG